MTMTLDDLKKWFRVTESYTVIRARVGPPYTSLTDVEVYQPGSLVMLYAPDNFWSINSSKGVDYLPEGTSHQQHSVNVYPVRMPHSPVCPLGENGIVFPGLAKESLIIIVKGTHSINEPRFLSLIELGVDMINAASLSIEEVKES